MAKKPELVEVEALEAFTITRPYGQFHGDPGSERNRLCKVPADALDDLVRRRKVHLPDWAEDPLDHDGDGRPGGSLPKDPPSLTGKNKAQLLAIAGDEGVEVDSDMTNAKIIEAIEAKRNSDADDAADANDAPPV